MFQKVKSKIRFTAMNTFNPKTEAAALDKKNGEAGFTLVEAVIATFIMTIITLAVAAAFAQSVRMNSGNSVRTQALAIANTQMEEMRNARFTSAITDTLLQGGVRTPETVTAEGRFFRLAVEVDDDPFTAGVQINSAKTLKEITIKVTPLSTTGAWQSGEIRVVARRVRAN
jgi:type II secretory pathway pseudopilin PulG